MYDSYFNVIMNSIDWHTKEKTDITSLGLYLSKQNEASALKILNIMIKAIQYSKLKRTMEVTRKVRIKETTFHGEVHEHGENIVSRLANNQLYLSREVLEHILKTNKINFNFYSYGIYSLHCQLAEILIDINNPQSNFYKRRDLAFKNLEILEYFSRKGIIKIGEKSSYSNEINNILVAYRTKSPEDAEINNVIYNILENRNKEKTAYNDIVSQNLDYDNLRWCKIKEKELPNFSNDDCVYLYNKVIPKIGAGKEIVLK